MIFSPYLDRLVLHLVGHCPLPAEQVVVVTDLSPHSGALDYVAQLKALKRLIGIGVEVRSLPRLHAKVLQVDRTVVTLGSQNFTSYARKSRECTAAPPEPVGDAQFLDTLEQWRADSIEVPEELVDRLLDQLAGQAAALKEASIVLQDAFDELIAVHERERQERRAAEQAAAARIEVERLAAERRRSDAWFEILTSRSTLRLAQRVALASVKTVGSWESGFFTALVADREYNLNEWVTSTAGTQETRALTRLRMYPLLLQESGRMGFARVGKERISYVRDGVEWGHLLNIHGSSTKVVTRLPDTGFTRRNITLELHPSSTVDRLVHRG